VSVDPNAAVGELNASEERALLRTLRDICDGHLTLWAETAARDPHTGEEYPLPRIVHVTPDRTPAAGTPNADGDWWTVMLRRGWLALHMRAGRPYLRAETPGIEALNATKDTYR
jgi:hypothetical protein